MHRPMIDMAYPSASGPQPAATLDRTYHSAYRPDSNMYGTYPRRMPGSNGSVMTNNNNNINNINAYGNSLMKPQTLPNGNHNNSSLRGILRNRHEYAPVALTPLYPDSSIIEENLDCTQDNSSGSGTPVDLSKSRGCLIRAALLMRKFIRPALSELLSVVFVSFIATFIESSILPQTADRTVLNCILAVVEGGLYAVSTVTFYNVRIHISPAVTLGSLFAGGIAPILAVVYWIVQIVGSCLGVFCYQVVAVDLHIHVPRLINSDDNNWFSGMYKVVLCQTFTSAMTVLCYTMTYIDPNDRNSPKSPVGVCSAVAISTFLSLVVCTASWNPARTLAICIVAAVHSINVSTWQYHYIFWLGPIIGSLFASFFYRLVFAEKGKRLTCCKTGGNQLLPN